MKIEEKKLLASIVFDESIDGKDIQKYNPNWNNPKSFIRWAVKKIKTVDDVLTLIDDNCPPYYFNLCFKKDIKENQIPNTEEIVEEKKKKGRPKKYEVS